MSKLILFFKKVYFFLLFILLECLAFGYYQNSSLYGNAKIMTVSTAVMGGAYSRMANVKHYFGLKKENQALLQEIARLESQLDHYRYGYVTEADSSLITLAQQLNRTDTVGNLYLYSSAAVINNSISKQQNYITIDKGLDHGIEPDMALLYEGSIVGYVLDCSDRYAVAISVLNTHFKTSGKIRGGDYFGSIFWDGTSYREVTFSEIPKYAQLAVGDTIETTNYSSIFPPGLMIGTVTEFELVNGTYYQAKVRLKLDMGRLRQVTLARYTDRDERRELERRVEDFN